MESLLKNKPLPKEILEYFKLDEKSPTGLIWIKKSADRTSIGSVAGRLSKKPTGYENYTVMFRYKFYVVSRIIWFIATGKDPLDNYIDHINGNPLDNRIENLRLVSPKLNSRNRKSTSSLIPGVSLHVNKYYKACWYENNKINIKYFSIKKLGKKLALDLAITLRLEKIKQLNEHGAGYTKRHINEK